MLFPVTTKVSRIYYGGLTKRYSRMGFYPKSGTMSSLKNPAKSESVRKPPIDVKPLEPQQSKYGLGLKWRQV
jgi:hypothetical protein